MNTVEHVKELCKSRKIPISKLEKDLGFANGYIGQLQKGVLPDNRLVAVAAYFDVSVDYLLGNLDIKKEPATDNGDELNKILQDPVLREITEILLSLDPEALKAALEMIRNVASLAKRKE